MAEAQKLDILFSSSRDWVASFWRREAISWAVVIGVGLRLCELEAGVGDGVFVLTVPGLSGHSQNRLLRVRPLQIGRVSISNVILDI